MHQAKYYFKPPMLLGKNKPDFAALWLETRPLKTLRTGVESQKEITHSWPLVTNVKFSQQNYRQDLARVGWKRKRREEALDYIQKWPLDF